MTLSQREEPSLPPHSSVQLTLNFSNTKQHQLWVCRSHRTPLARALASGKGFPAPGLFLFSLFSIAAEFHHLKSLLFSTSSSSVSHKTPCLRPWDSPGKNTGVGCHFLLQGIFLTQGSNPGLPRCRQTDQLTTREVQQYWSGKE